jgi:hypothetical protein
VSERRADGEVGKSDIVGSEKRKVQIMSTPVNQSKRTEKNLHPGFTCRTIQIAIMKIL